jgi:hypothetical protein
MMKPVFLLAAILVGGCAELKAFTTCTLLAGVANQRSYTFDGRVNGKRYKDTVSWTADYKDPNYLDPLDCTSMMSQRMKQVEAERQSAGNSAPPTVQTTSE